MPLGKALKAQTKSRQAELVIPLDSNNKPATKPASSADRLVSLESFVGIWKALRFLVLVGVIALTVEKFVL